MSILPNECVFCRSESIYISKFRRSTRYLDELYKFAKCKDCGNYQNSPMPSRKTIDLIYSREYTIKNVPSELIAIKRIAISDLHLRKFLNSQREVVKQKNFLDFGCGENPISLSVAANAGYEAFGYEYDLNVSISARANSGKAIYYGDELNSCEMKFDCIFLGDVIEHLVSPIGSLKILRNLLADDGYLVIQGPLENSRSLSHFVVALKALTSRSRVTEMPPYHVTLSNRHSIKKLLHTTGFRVIKMETFEVSWPAKPFLESLKLMSVRDLILSTCKIFDIIISRLVPTYGNRFFLVAEK